MSKIGKKPIEIPSGVTVTVKENTISVKGPKGELVKPLTKGIIVVIESNLIKISPESGNKENTAKWGLQRALIANMIAGTTAGFEKILEFQGVGYKASVKPARPDARLNDSVGQDSGRLGGGNDLELNLGYSHPITIPGVEGITFSVEKNAIKISGLDKELIGKVAAEIREKRPPEPYKGSGIRYKGEVIKKKAGKKAVTAG